MMVHVFLMSLVNEKLVHIPKIHLCWDAKMFYTGRATKKYKTKHKSYTSAALHDV